MRKARKIPVAGKSFVGSAPCSNTDVLASEKGHNKLCAVTSVMRPDECKLTVRRLKIQQSRTGKVGVWRIGRTP